MSLWAGAELKLDYAAFHFNEMRRALDPPRRSTHEIAQMSTGAVIDTGWHRRFYPHFDAFLSTSR